MSSRSYIPRPRPPPPGARGRPTGRLASAGASILSAAASPPPRPPSTRVARAVVASPVAPVLGYKGARGRGRGAPRGAAGASGLRLPRQRSATHQARAGGDPGRETRGGAGGDVKGAVRGGIGGAAAAGAAAGALADDRHASLRPHETTRSGFRSASVGTRDLQRLGQAPPPALSRSSSARAAAATSGDGAAAGALEPYSAAFVLEQNKRDYQEDRVVVENFLGQRIVGALARAPRARDALAGLRRLALFAALDGHAGDCAVRFVERELVKQLGASCAAVAGAAVADADAAGEAGGEGGEGGGGGAVDVEALLRAALRHCIAQLEARYCEVAREKKWRSGTCANICLLADTTLLVANVGDCRAILCAGGRPRQLSRDHTPNNEAEMARIRAAGGSVEFVNGQHRVMPAKIAVARSIGDPRAKMPRPLLSAEPDVTVHEVEPSARALVVATDGIWGRLSNKDVMNVIRKAATSAAAAEQLAARAIAKGSWDNIGCCVVYF